MTVFFRDRDGLVHVPSEYTVPQHPWSSMACARALTFVPGKTVHVQDMRELLCYRVRNNEMLTCIACIANYAIRLP